MKNIVLQRILLETAAIAVTCGIFLPIVFAEIVDRESSPEKPVAERREQIEPQDITPPEDEEPVDISGKNIYAFKTRPPVKLLKTRTRSGRKSLTQIFDERLQEARVRSSQKEALSVAEKGRSIPPNNKEVVKKVKIQEPEDEEPVLMPEPAISETKIENVIPEVPAAIEKVDFAIEASPLKEVKSEPEQEVVKELEITKDTTQLPKDETAIIRRMNQIEAEILKSPDSVEEIQIPDTLEYERRMEQIEQSMLSETRDNEQTTIIKSDSKPSKMHKPDLITTPRKPIMTTPQDKTPVQHLKAIEATEVIEHEIESGETAARQGQNKKAYDTFSRLIRKEPGNAKVNFSFGVSCFSLEKYSQARLAFERVLQIDPSHIPARFALARTLLVTKQDEIAAEEFKRVLKYNPTIEIKKAVESYLLGLEKGENEWTLIRKLGVGYIYDDNVNIGPDSDVIYVDPSVFGRGEFAVNDKTKPKESDGVYISASASGVRSIGERDKWSLFGEVGCYKNFMSDASDNESLFLQAILGPRRLWARSMFQAPLMFSYINYGGDPLVNIIGVTPTYLYVAGEKSDYYWVTATSLQSRKYDDIEEMDGSYTSIGETVKKYVGKKGHILSLGGVLFRETTSSRVNENSGSMVKGGVVFKLPKKLKLYARALAMSKDYDEKHPLALEIREDSQTQFILGVNKAFNLPGKTLTVDFSQQAINNESTFDLYQYERNVTILSTTVKF